MISKVTHLKTIVQLSAFFGSKLKDLQLLWFRQVVLETVVLVRPGSSTAQYSAAGCLARLPASFLLSAFSAAGFLCLGVFPGSTRQWQLASVYAWLLWKSYRLAP